MVSGLSMIMAKLASAFRAAPKKELVCHGPPYQVHL